MSRLITYFILFGLIVFFALILIRNLFPSERERVLRLIEKGRKAVEDEDITRIASLIDKDYYDAWGHDYQRLVKFLRNNFRIYDDIKVFVPFRKVVFEYPFAQCSLIVRVRGRSVVDGEDLIYASPLILFLIKENKRWFITAALQ